MNLCYTVAYDFFMQTVINLTASILENGYSQNLHTLYFYKSQPTIKFALAMTF